MYPWGTALSKIIAYYLIPESNSFRWLHSNLKEKIVYGPVLCIFCFGLFPIGISGLIFLINSITFNNIIGYCTGFILWVFVCCIFPRKKYSYLELCPKGNHQSNEPSKEVFTLATCNVLLANETFCRWNNNGNPLARSKLIGIMYYIVVSAIMSHRCSFRRLFFFHVSLFSNFPNFSSYLYLSARARWQ